MPISEITTYGKKNMLDKKNSVCLISNKTPSTLIRFQTKMELFCSGYGNRPHYNAENDHRKRSHSKTLSRVDDLKTMLFENAFF